MGALLRALQRLFRGRSLSAEEGRRCLHRLAILYDYSTRVAAGGLEAEADSEATLTAWQQDLGRPGLPPWRDPEAVLEAIRDYLRPELIACGYRSDGEVDYVGWCLYGPWIEVGYCGPRPEWGVTTEKAEVVDLDGTAVRTAPPEVCGIVALLGLISPAPPFVGPREGGIDPLVDVLQNAVEPRNPIPLPLP